jgi:hypothetical protein
MFPKRALKNALNPPCGIARGKTGSAAPYSRPRDVPAAGRGRKQKAARCAMRLFWNTGDHDPDRCGGGALWAESYPTDFLEHKSARSATEHIRVQDFFVCLARECTWAAALVLGHADHRRATRSTGCAGRTGRARWTLITFFALDRLAIATRGEKHAKKSYRQNVPHIRSLVSEVCPTRKFPRWAMVCALATLNGQWRGPPNRGPQVASEKPKRTLPTWGPRGRRPNIGSDNGRYRGRLRLAPGLIRRQPAADPSTDVLQGRPRGQHCVGCFFDPTQSSPTRSALRYVPIR